MQIFKDKNAWNRLLLLTPCDIMNKLLQQFIHKNACLKIRTLCKYLKFQKRTSIFFFKY